MSTPVPGDPKVDENFAKFLEEMENWSYERLDNVDAPLLKKATSINNAFKGRLEAAVITNLEQQIGALKGEFRKSKKRLTQIPIKGLDSF